MVHPRIWKTDWNAKTEGLQMVGSRIEFKDFFRQATGIEEGPFPYQERLATGDDLPQIVDIPTGCGKTAAVILSWIWRRRFNSDTRMSTPRRLVYCLPMRVLVEQTREEAMVWLKNVGMLADYPGDNNRLDSWSSLNGDLGGHRISVTILMGGEDSDEWDHYPERDAIIIGTQDMLLSRALNRGYGMSRYRWPVHYALLNNDCLWIMDEVQLMGVGVETSAQLQAFRKIFGTHKNASSIWMSATITGDQLNTVDQDISSDKWMSIMLGKEDATRPTVVKRKNARKTLTQAPVVISPDGLKADYPLNLAKFILENHEKGTFTLVVVNNVKRAQDIYRNLVKLGRSQENTAVLHSRFREADRREKMNILKMKGDRILVSTQVVEAGVDISAKMLITEIALWSSLVQRFGRCNRYGEFNESHVFWIDIQTIDEKGKDHAEMTLPYEMTDIITSRSILEKLVDVSPNQLDKVNWQPQPINRPVIRRRDLIELFDTTPDLTGNDLDVSRYVRDGDDKDVQVYWRDIPESGPTPDFEKAGREELCSVSIGEISNFLKKKDNTGWIWDHLDASWKKITKAIPGQIVLLDPHNGGYLPSVGWIGIMGNRPELVETIQLPETNGMKLKKNDVMNGEDGFPAKQWIPIITHCTNVSNNVRELANKLEISTEKCEALKQAGLWHDVGKAHEAFQNMLLKNRENISDLKDNGPWAKSDNYGSKADYFMMEGEKKISRNYFRHELASALAWLQTKGANHDQGDLIAYLIAAHHGKIRQSIRSLPNENEPPGEQTLFARGIWHGDYLPNVPTITDGEIEMNLSLMNMGEGSWLERTLRLRDEYGPFELALLEAVLRVIDWKVSATEERGVSQ